MHAHSMVDLMKKKGGVVISAHNFGQNNRAIKIWSLFFGYLIF
jgi:hypothetical protein